MIILSNVMHVDLKLLRKYEYRYRFHKRVVLLIKKFSVVKLPVIMIWGPFY